ncbi:hypothetical protein LSH36_14g12089 [Paralvinella palmiformis]|uniref:Fucosyltransferase n=1 Tax=Paralvinella palmiformis TaxID=53620 RepID=A0AAD9KCT1_9ANNE|nr:hypothetical protein LSH36_14g12089 [Paralvinella palmiformis]
MHEYVTVAVVILILSEFLPSKGQTNIIVKSPIRLQYSNHCFRRTSRNQTRIRQPTVLYLRFAEQNRQSSPPHGNNKSSHLASEKALVADDLSMAIIRLLVTRLLRQMTRPAFLVTVIVLGLCSVYYLGYIQMTRAYSLIRRQTSSSTLILLWDFYDDDNFNQRLNGMMQNGGCPVSNCRFTTSRDDMDLSDAVIFNPILQRSYLPQRSFPGQIYVMYNMEPPTSFIDYPFDKYRGQYNLTMTYLDHPDTDIRIPLGYVMRRQNNSTVRKVTMRTKSRMVAWVVSNCNATGQRWRYAKELSKYIQVDVYGQCGALTCGKHCFRNIEKKYKFYLAFEKCYCKQYLTEKVFRTLNYNIVPIVLGGADYSELFPRHSYIDVRDFRSPKHLASYLKELDQNNHHYVEYFSWKMHLKAVDGRNKTAAFCRLCEVLHDRSYPYKKDFDLEDFWSVSDTCLLGDEEKAALNL